MNETTTPRPPSGPTKKLMRDPNNVIGGVAAGLAHHLDMDVALVRLALLFAFFAIGVGPIVYLVAWVIIPMSPHPLGRTDYLGGVPA